MLENVSLTQLRAFAAVARRKNFTHAAADLDYTPPAVHHQVRALERVLGFPLVKRNTSPIVMTEEAEALLPHIEALLYQVGQVSQAVRGLQVRGTVELGSAENAGISIVMPLLSALAEAIPVHVNLHIHEARVLVDLVRDGSLDVAISARFRTFLGTPSQRGDLRLVRWGQDMTTLVEPSAPSRRSADSDAIFVPPYTTAETVRTLVAGSRYASWPLVHMLTGDAARGAARHGLGAAALPLSAVQADIESGVLRVPDSVPPRPYTVHLLHRPPASMGASSRTFLRFLLEHRPRFTYSEVCAKAAV